jgi:hypothetical protein
MKFTIESFTRLEGQTHVEESPVLHVWSTQAVAPWYACANVTHAPVAIDVPSTEPYDALVVELLVDVVTDEGRRVRAHAGRAVLNRFTFATGEVQLMNDTRTRPTAWLKFSCDVHPRSTGVDPDGDAAADICADLTTRSSRWFEKGHPVNKEIERVHIPRLPGIFKNAPGFVFAAHRPCEPEEEELFERAVVVAAARRGENAHELAVKVISEINVPDDQPSKAVHRIAKYLAEGIQLLVNNLPYLADPDIVKDKVNTVDRFSTDVRMTMAGDCEDCAREIALMWSLARRCTGTTPLVRAIALIARCYVSCEHLGAVNLQGNPFLDVYSTGGKYYAHAFAQIIPTHWFRAALYNDDAFTKLKLSSDTLIPWEHGLYTLTLDGVRLCDADAFAPSFPVKKLLDALSDTADDDLTDADVSQAKDEDAILSRLKCIEKVGTKHYVFVSSSYVFDSFVTDKHCPVYEISYLQPDGSYGASFQQMHQNPPELRVFCTHGDESCSDDAHAMAYSFCKYLHPVTKWDAAGAPTLEALTELARNKIKSAGLDVSVFDPHSANANSDVRAKPSDAVHAVLGPTECVDEKYLGSFARLLKQKGYTKCRLQAERLARGASSVFILVWR